MIKLIFVASIALTAVPAVAQEYTQAEMAWMSGMTSKSSHIIKSDTADRCTTPMRSDQALQLLIDAIDASDDVQNARITATASAIKQCKRFL